VGVAVLINSEMILVIDFMNLKIKPTQSFRGAHKSRVCVHMFIWISDHTYMSICVCTVFLKKSLCTHTIRNVEGFCIAD
jgi:hypothetical protein